MATGQRCSAGAHLLLVLDGCEAVVLGAEPALLQARVSGSTEESQFQG